MSFLRIRSRLGRSDTDKLSITKYCIVNDQLYRRSYSSLLLLCVGPRDVDYALWEVHEGIRGEHIRAKTLAHKILRQGYY